MTIDQSPATRCPRCQAGLLTQRNAVPWCPDCQWGLDRYEPDRRKPEFGWRWVDRRLFRMRVPADRPAVFGAARAAGRQGRLDSGAVRPDHRGPGALRRRGSAVRLGRLPHRVPVPELADRAGRLPGPRRARPVAQARAARPGRPAAAPEQAPTLFRLIDDVAAAVGAPAPHLVEADSRFNASTSAVGLRRRRVMRLGMPMWAVLPPQQRVALIGHELGHFVNGDARRGPVTRVPLTTLGRLADLLRPARPVRDYGIAGVIGEALAGVLLGTLRKVVQAGHVGLVWVCLRDSQRAEYLADELAARAAGSTAAAQLADTLVLSDSLFAVARREARRAVTATGWLAAADALRIEVVPRLPGMRQLSVRDEVSLFATHPPTGLRARMIESRPYQPAAVILTAADSARIDEELAKVYDNARRDLAAL